MFYNGLTQSIYLIVITCTMRLSWFKMINYNVHDLLLTNHIAKRYKYYYDNNIQSNHWFKLDLLCYLLFLPHYL